MPILYLKKPINDFPQVQIQIDYNLGGMNYFNYKEEKRGYYLRFSPCKHKDLGNGMYSTEMQPMHERSFKVCIKEMNRKSNKTFHDLNMRFMENLSTILEKYEESNEAVYKFIKELFKLGE